MPIIEKLGIACNQASFQVVGQNGEIVLNHVADHRNRSGGVSYFERAVPQTVHEIVNQFRQKWRKPLFIKEEKIKVGGEAEFTTAEPPTATRAQPSWDAECSLNAMPRASCRLEE